MLVKKDTEGSFWPDLGQLSCLEVPQSKKFVFGFFFLSITISMHHMKREKRVMENGQNSQHRNQSHALAIKC